MTKMLRDERGRLLPGQGSLNPGGRVALRPETRAAIANCGNAAVQRLEELITDQSAFGKDGWLPSRDQIRLIEVATDRAFGKPEITRQVTGDVEHYISAESAAALLDQVYAALDPPELRRARRADVARSSKVIDLDPESFDGVK